jgi:hypothetical protein
MQRSSSPKTTSVRCRCSEGQIVGIVSEGDLINREEIGTKSTIRGGSKPSPRQRRLPQNLPNRAESAWRRSCPTMSSPPPKKTPLAEIAAILERNRIRRVPISTDKKLVGIVSRSNLVQALASSDATSVGRPNSDRVIREEILLRLKQQQSWTDFGSPQHHRDRPHGLPLGSDQLGSRAQSIDRACRGRTGRHAGDRRDDPCLLTSDVAY